MRSISGNYRNTRQGTSINVAWVHVGEGGDVWESSPVFMMLLFFSFKQDTEALGIFQILGRYHTHILCELVLLCAGDPESPTETQTSVLELRLEGWQVTLVHFCPLILRMECKGTGLCTDGWIGRMQGNSTNWVRSTGCESCSASLWFHVPTQVFHVCGHMLLYFMLFWLVFKVASRPLNQRSQVEIRSNWDLESFTEWKTGSKCEKSTLERKAKCQVPLY